MKRRSLTLVICLLATLSLASVGFASWVISAGDTENVTGNVQVQAVTDRRLEIKDGAFENDLDSIKFGIPSEEDGYDPSEDDWLKPDGAEFPEDILSIKYIFDLNFVTEGEEVVIEGSGKNVDLTAEFKDDEPDSTKQWILDAVTFGYIEQPTLSVAKNAVTGRYECTIEFQWGDLFNNMNPWEYYNANQITGDAGIVDDMFGQKLNDGSDITVYHLLYQLRDVTPVDGQTPHEHSFDENGKCTGSHHCKGDDPRTNNVEASDHTFDYPCRAMQADYGDHALLVLQRMYDFLNSKTFDIVIEAKEHVHSYDALTNTCECGATK